MFPSFRTRPFSLLCPLFACVMLALPQPMRAAEATEAKTYEVTAVKDLTYYDGADQDKVKHKLDLYLPKDKKDFPVLFFVHGGSWVHGDKSELGLYSAVGRCYASQGIGVVVINYRLSPGVKHPEHVKDVARAFAWTVKNIEKYGGRADQLFLCGHSAGGHLVALLATDETYLKAEGVSLKNVKGVIPISGVFDVPVKLLPEIFGSGDDLHEKVSPTCNVKTGLPPFLIVYADKDLKYCDKDQAQAFFKALKDKECEATICEIPNSNHLMTLFSASSPDAAVSKKIVEFIGKQTANPK